MELVMNAVDQVAAWWTINGGTVILWSLVATAVFLVWAFLWVRKHGHTSRALSIVSNALVLGLSSEGMWEFLRELLELPVPIALGFFAVGEFMLLNAMIHARAHYHRTTVWNETGTEVVSWGTTGRHGTAVWVIASAMGVIVATGADRWEEVPFRLFLPLGAALMWYTELTAGGVGEGEKSSWIWTPRTIGIRLKLIRPGASDLQQTQKDHLRAGLIKHSLRYHGAADDDQDQDKTWFQRRSHRVMTRLGREASDEDIAYVRQQVGKAQHIGELTSPSATASHAVQVAEVQAAAEREIEAVRKATAQQVSDLGQELARLRATHETDQAAARQAQEKLTDQLADMERDATAALTEMRDRETAAQREAETLRRELERLRPAAAAAERLQAERDQALRDRDQAVELVTQRVQPGAPTGDGNWRELASPRADGSLALQPETVANTRMSTKERVMTVLDAGRVGGRVNEHVETRVLADYAIQQLPGITDGASVDTIVSYAREWARETREGRRGPRPGLRLVDNQA